MKISLKKIKIFESGSEETICFTADLYADDVKIGAAHNEGRGGPTSYHADAGKKELLEKAEAYCKTLPAEELPSKHSPNGVFIIPMDLEHVIDDIIYEELNKKDRAKFERQMQKNMEKKLLFTDEPEGQPVNSYSETWFKGFTIQQLLSNPKGIQAIKNAILRQKEKGLRCINTNLPADVFSTTNQPA